MFATIGVISAHPEVGTPISRNTRRFLVKRFPFGVIYQSKGSTLRIIAVADLRRRPGYWEDRALAPTREHGSQKARKAEDRD